MQTHIRFSLEVPRSDVHPQSATFLPMVSAEGHHPTSQLHTHTHTHQTHATHTHTPDTRYTHTHTHTHHTHTSHKHTPDTRTHHTHQTHTYHTHTYTRHTYTNTHTHTHVTHENNEGEKDDQEGVVPLLKNSRSSDPTPNTAVKQDTGYESRLTESQTAELLAEVHIHQQCSQLTLPNPMTDWAM